jgi:hypothetical protein
MRGWPCALALAAKETTGRAATYKARAGTMVKYLPEVEKQSVDDIFQQSFKTTELEAKVLKSFVARERSARWGQQI